MPLSLRRVIPPFDWDVRAVWALDAPTVVVPRTELDPLLTLPMWSSRRGCGPLFDLVPLDVLADPALHPRHRDRIEAADVRFPLDFLLQDGDRYVLDGLHRLARLHRDGVTEVSVRHHGPAVADRIRMDASA